MPSARLNARASSVFPAPGTSSVEDMAVGQQRDSQQANGLVIDDHRAADRSRMRAEPLPGVTADGTIAGDRGLPAASTVSLRADIRACGGIVPRDERLSASETSGYGLTPCRLRMRRSER
jgi:hypothetical protein